MNNVTRILSQIESGDPNAAEELLPLVYDELRKLAAARMAQEKPGQTLQATALVHDAYVRLVDVEKAQHWNSRRHFFAAAAEAMRRILVDQARRKKAERRGGQSRRLPVDAAEIEVTATADELLDIDEALPTPRSRCADGCQTGGSPRPQHDRDMLSDSVAEKRGLTRLRRTTGPMQESPFDQWHPSPVANSSLTELARLPAEACQSRSVPASSTSGTTLSVT